MKFSDWHVVLYPENSRRTYYYGTLQEVAEQIEESNAQIVPDEQWTIDDLVEIASNLLEDANLHSRINEPRDIVNMMRAVDIPDCQIRLFMIREYVVYLFNKYGEGY